MLSGYWVLLMHQEKYAPSGPDWIFYLSRFMRIWLPFATAFEFAFLAFWISGDPKSAAMHGGLPLLGIATTKLDVLGTSWSLDIELQFYLLLPFLSSAWAWVGRERARLTGLAVICAILTVAGWIVQLHFGIWNIFAYPPPFIIGALIWHLRASPSGVQALLSLALLKNDQRTNTHCVRVQAPGNLTFNTRTT